MISKSHNNQVILLFYIKKCINIYKSKVYPKELDRHNMINFNLNLC